MPTKGTEDRFVPEKNRPQKEKRNGQTNLSLFLCPRGAEELCLIFKTRKIPSLSQAKGFFVFGGADGARTRDLLTASQTFSQLNYGPTKSVNLTLQSMQKENLCNTMLCF